MLKFSWRSTADVIAEPSGSIGDRNPALRIRNLLDDPALRRSMRIDADRTTFATMPRPEPRLTQRRLLARAAA